MKQTYGDVVAEQRALTSAAAVVEGAHDVLWVEGPGAVSFLQGVVSQDVESMPDWGVARSFFLEPRGKLRALLWLAKAPDRVAVVADAGQGSHVAEQLEYYRIRVKAEIRLEAREIWELWGPDSLSVAGLSESDRWRETNEGTLIPIPMRGFERVLGIGGAPPTNLPRAGVVATRAVRVAHLEPVFGVDVDEKTIPQETGLAGEAVSFEKGCYLGQELVARIDTRGHVNRVLRRLAITRNVLPPDGAAVVAGEREVGKITSVTEDLTSPVGLALLRREVEAGDEVLVRWISGEAPAVVKGPPEG